MRRMARVLAPAACALMATGAASAQQLPQPPPQLMVTGTSEAQAVPDVATVSVGVVRQGPNAQEAQSQVNQVATAIIEAITRLGIQRAQIRTQQITLTPIYAPQPPRPQPQQVEEPRIIGYRAANVISVRIEDLTRIGPVIDAALGAGANQLQGVAFGLRNDLPARQAALRQAAQEARQKAATLAEAMGVQLGEVLEIAEGGVGIRSQVYAAEAMDFRMAAATPVEPGELTIHASVSVRYRIVQ
jgi:uncharacterized protein